MPGVTPECADGLIQMSDAEILQLTQSELCARLTPYRDAVRGEKKEQIALASALVRCCSCYDEPDERQAI